MFDEQTNKSNPPANLPTEPADMFAGVEKDDTQLEMPEKTPDALGAGLLRKKESTVPNMSAAPMVAPSLYEVKQPIIGKVILFLVVAVVLGGIGFGGWYVYNKFIKKASPANVVVIPTTNDQQPVAVTPVEEQKPTEAPVVNVLTATTSDVTANMNNDKILFGEAVDSDKDGLDDVRERELGTGPYKSDTDGDGLNDGDEVIIWKTNPLNPDTDGDSYKDGEEVRNGYNPLGAGKLFNVPAGVSTSTVSPTAKVAPAKLPANVVNKK
ncbi:MAG: hypothetical protein WCV83_02915 [Candidatus Magasanikbacteria bacterium]|jgi:hypothetical protein